MSNEYLDIAMEKVIKQEVNEVLNKIKAEIVEYKDDKIIHAERNEMIDIVLDVIDKHIGGQE